MRALALAALLAFLPLAARAEEPAGPVFPSQTPAPETFSALRWGDHPGYWYSREQVLRINGRINYLEQKAAKECVDAQVQNAGGLPAWVLIVAGVVVGGAAGYFGARAIK